MNMLIKLKSLYIDKFASYKNNDNKKAKFNYNYIYETKSNEIKHFSDDISIETVNNFKGFKDFYNFPFHLYKNNPYWIAPFWIEFKDFFKIKNPFWTHADCILFIAKKNNKIVGRIAGIIDNKFCESIDKKVGYFGFFECIEDFKCAEALLKSVQSWLVSKDINVMRGPINGRVDISCGFLCNGFDSHPSLLSSYSPSYYILFAKKFDMKKARDFLLYHIDLQKPIPQKLKEKVQECEASGVKIRPFKRLRTQKELKWWINLFLDTFNGHWGYVPVSKEEVRVRFGMKQLRWYVDSKLFLVAEQNGSPIAYLWSTPDYNQVFNKMKGKLGLYQIFQFLLRKHLINQGKLHFIGIKKDFRNKNIGSYLNYKALVEMKKRGYIGAKVGLIDEKNTVAHATIAKTDAKVVKKFRVFDKKIK